MPPLPIMVTAAPFGCVYGSPVVPVGSGVGGDSVICGGAVIVKIAVALVTDWPSGFVTVTVRADCDAFDAMVTFRVIRVGSVYVTLLTVTPPPFTVAEM